MCVPVDYANPTSLKNHNEIRRCFAVLAHSFPDRVVTFLLTRLDNSNDRIRTGTLAVFKQLINSAGKRTIMIIIYKLLFILFADIKWNLNVIRKHDIFELPLEYKMWIMTTDILLNSID